MLFAHRATALMRFSCKVILLCFYSLFSLAFAADFTNKTTTSGLGDDLIYQVYFDGSKIYAATDGGLSISSDGGNTFVNKTTANGLGANPVTNIYVYGSMIYAFTGNFSSNIKTQYGLSISSDGGNTFTHKTTANGLGSNLLYGLTVSNSKVYVATGQGLSISSDGGYSFVNKTTSDGLGDNSTSDVYVDGLKVYVATNGGLSVSTDGGNTFVNKTTANGLGDNLIRRIVVNNSTMYVGTNGGLSISTDGGNTFVNKTTANGLGGNNVMGIYSNGSTIYATTKMLSGFSIMGSGLSISTDGGNTFVNKTTANGLGSDLITDIDVAGSALYVSTDAGLSISTDGGNTFVNKTTAEGLGNNFISNVFINNSTIYAATLSGLSLQDTSLTITKTGDGNGTVSATGIDCGGDCVETYKVGTQVTLKAAASSDSKFISWSGSCSGSDSPLTITMDQVKSCNAFFEKFPVVLTVNKTGNGQVTGGGTFAIGTTVKLTATPDDGYQFVNWSPSTCSDSFAMPASNLICTATFEKKPDVIVTPPPAVSQCTTFVAPIAKIPCVNVYGTPYQVEIKLIATLPSLRFEVDMGTLSKLASEIVPTEECAVFPAPNTANLLKINCLDLGDKYRVEMPLVPNASPFQFDVGRVEKY